MASPGNQSISVVAVIFLGAPAQEINHRGFGSFRDRRMKTLRNILFILVICRVCSKAVIHTYRHFYPPAAAIVGP
jgi:hypothetical protein